MKIVLDLPPSVWVELAETIDELARTKVRDGQERASEHLLAASAEIEKALGAH